MKIATDNMKGMKNYALERLSKNYAKKPLDCSHSIFQEIRSMSELD
jgi:hypothetical protein